MRSVTQPYCNTVENGCFSLRMRFFSQNFGTIKRILPGSSSSSHREGPGTEVDMTQDHLMMRNFSRINKSTSCLTSIFQKTSIRFLKHFGPQCITGMHFRNRGLWPF